MINSSTKGKKKGVLVVAHGGVVRALICHLLGLAASNYLLFDIQPFDDNLDDPVSLAHPVKIVFQVTDGDEIGAVLDIKVGGARLEAALQALADNAIAHGRMVEGQAFLF